MIYNPTKTGTSKFPGSGIHIRTPKRRLSDQEVLDEINARSAVGGHGRDPVHQALEREWMVNVAFYLGLQGTSSSALANQLDIDINLLSPDEQYIANHIKRMVNQQVSRLARSRGEVEVVPKSADYRDQAAAKVGEDFLGHLYEELNLDSKRRDFLYWCVICGTSYFYTGWDPYRGTVTKRFTSPSDGQMLSPNQLPDGMRQDMEEMGMFEEVTSGDFDVEILAPFQVLVSKDFLDFDTTPWVVIERVVSPDYIWERWPQKARDVRPDNASTDPRSTYWRRLASLALSKGYTMPGQGFQSEESILIRELWRPPSALVKEGVYAVATEDTVLENQPHKFARDGVKVNEKTLRYPLVRSRFSVVPGRWWGSGMVDDLIGPQREYNRTRQQTIEQRDRLSHAQWLAPKSTQLTSTRNEYGDFWLYNAGAGKPELVQPPALSQAHQDTADRAMDDMRLISAQSEASQSSVPTGVRSGVGLRALKEGDLQSLGIVVEELEACFTQVNSNLLAIAGTYVHDARIINVYGRQFADDVRYFKGEMLRGNYKARVVPGTMEPRSRAEQSEVVMELLSIGAMNPATSPEDKRLMMEKLELGMPEMLKMEDLQRRRARKNIELFREPTIDPDTGKPRPFPDARDFDDPQVAIDEIVRFMLTDEFEEWPMERQMALQALKLQYSLMIFDMISASQPAMGGPQGPGGGSPPAPVGEAPKARARQKTPGTESVR